MEKSLDLGSTFAVKTSENKIAHVLIQHKEAPFKCCGLCLFKEELKKVIELLDEAYETMEKI